MNVGISYSWDGPTHKNRVAELVDKLSTKFEVMWDADLTAGHSQTQFMEKLVHNNDFVILICTPNYKQKFDERRGGVGYEGDMIASGLYSGDNHTGKFIPLIFSGGYDHALPRAFDPKNAIDFNNWPYEQEYELVQGLIDLINLRNTSALYSKAISRSPLTSQEQRQLQKDLHVDVIRIVHNTEFEWIDAVEQMRLGVDRAIHQTGVPYLCVIDTGLVLSGFQDVTALFNKLKDVNAFPTRLPGYRIAIVSTMSPGYRNAIETATTQDPINLKDRILQWGIIGISLFDMYQAGKKAEHGLEHIMGPDKWIYGLETVEEAVQWCKDSAAGSLNTF